MNKLKKYVIATPENPDHFTSAAYLLEIKDVEIPPFIVRALSDKKNNPVITYERVRAFEIVKVLRKATDGTSSLNNSKYVEICKEHKEKEYFKEASSKYSKINFRNKFSKDDMDCLKPGSIFMAPDILNELFFVEFDEEHAIGTFDYIVENKLYIGPLNNNISLSYGYMTNMENIIVGRSENNNYEAQLSDKDLIHASYQIGDKYYLGISSGLDFSAYSMESKFIYKLELYLYHMHRTVQNFQNLYNMIRSKNSNFAGFRLNSMDISGYRNNMPIPILKWDDYFSVNNEDDFNRFLCTDIEDFLFNKQNFICPREDFAHDMKTTIPFLKDNTIIIDGDYRGPIKEYLENYKEKK